MPNKIKLTVNMLSGVYWFDDALQRNFKALGLEQFMTTRAQSLLIANIASGEHRATRLARKLGLTRQAISHMLSTMQERGIVEVTVDPTDARAQIVNFTPVWIPMREAARRIMDQLEVELARRIGRKDFDTLKRAMDADWGEPPLLPMPAGERRRSAGKAARSSGSRKPKGRKK